MQHFDWNEAKNAELKDERGIGFEDIQAAIEAGNVLGDATHTNIKRYPNQRILIVKINNYAHSVPYVPSENRLFLKTIYASRKYTKKYLR